MGELMATSIPKNEYLKHLLKLSGGLKAALERGDVDVASALYEERARYFETHQPDDSPAAEGLVDQLLASDRAVVALANSMRGRLANSGRTLKQAKGYGETSLPPRPGGNWGSG